ncbi:helix-turn-helix domain-containing protein [Paenibacillus sp. J5C_2022]|nr:helix-turn-helix domain-containing protein [Paenibacillus sp. J5C2022]
MALTITALLFQAFSKGSTKQINEISQKGLEQSASMLEFMANQTRLITLQLSLDPDIIQSIYKRGTAEDYFVNQTALRKLHNVMLTNTNIYSITLYNGQSGTLIGTDRDKAYAEAPTIEWLQDENVQSLGRMVPRHFPALHSDGDGDKVYTVFYYDRHPDRQEILSAIIVNMTIDEAVYPKEPQTGDFTFFAMDRQGRTVYSPYQEGFLSNLSSRSDVQRILSSRASSSFVSVEDGAEALVSSTYSEQLDWYFVSLIPYKTAMAPITEVRRTSIIICLLLLLLACCISAALSGILSSPLKKLARNAQSYQLRNAELPSNESLSEMEILTSFYSNMMIQFDKLKASSRLSRKSMKAEYVKELLQGIRQPESADREMYQLMPDLAGPTKLYVAVLKLDGIREREMREPEFGHQAHELLSRLAESYMQQRMACEVVKLEQEVAMVISGEDLEWPVLLEVLRGLQQEIVSQYSFSISVGVGCPITEGIEISEAYLKAKEAIQYRLIQGKGHILVYDEMLKLVNGGFEYPYDKQKRLLEVIREGKEDKVESVVADLFQSLHRAPYSMIRLSVQQLLFSIVTAETDASISTVSTGFMDILSVLQRMDSLSEMQEWFVAFGKASIQRSKVNKKQMKSELAAEIAAFLEEQYGNAELSIEIAAEHFRYNGVYFGRLFKELFNQLFLEYVTELRIRKANEYLLTTKLMVKEIGRKVGFLNPSYFVTWYKKQTGLAPSEYRKKHKR